MIHSNEAAIIEVAKGVCDVVVAAVNAIIYLFLMIFKVLGVLLATLGNHPCVFWVVFLFWLVYFVMNSMKINWYVLGLSYLPVSVGLWLFDTITSIVKNWWSQNGEFALATAATSLVLVLLIFGSVLAFRLHEEYRENP